MRARRVVRPRGRVRERHPRVLDLRQTDHRRPIFAHARGEHEALLRVHRGRFRCADGGDLVIERRGGTREPAETGRRVFRTRTVVTVQVPACQRRERDRVEAAAGSARRRVDEGVAAGGKHAVDGGHRRGGGGLGLRAIPYKKKRTSDADARDDVISARAAAAALAASSSSSSPTTAIALIANATSAPIVG
eukprot:31486-Pelagococcus_subviridis.AAC.4